jgi:Holliday junction resolvase RusA-like endonuclease
VIRIVIPGDPIGKQSVRVTASGHSYMPGKTAAWTAFAVETIARNWPAGVGALDGPIRLRITSVKLRPATMIKKKWPDGRTWCPTKPDADNISKAVCDAMSKAGVWVDDSRICDERIITLYTAKTGDAPCVIVDVEPIKGEPGPGFRGESLDEESPFG